MELWNQGFFHRNSFRLCGGSFRGWGTRGNFEGLSLSVNMPGLRINSRFWKYSGHGRRMGIEVQKPTWRACSLDENHDSWAIKPTTRVLRVLKKQVRRYMSSRNSKALVSSALRDTPAGPSLTGSTVSTTESGIMKL
jgi:hypothetical protein